MYEADECGDLPPLVPSNVVVRLPKEQAAYYDAEILKLRNMKTFDYEVADNSYTIMRRITSGYIQSKIDDDSEITITFKENPKLDALEGNY